MTYRLSRRPGKRAGGRTGGGALTLFQQFTALSGNLIADFDPSNPALVTLGAGANVSALASSVGGHVVSQAVEANQPDYSAIAINGRPGITYNGTSDRLAGAAGLAALVSDVAPYSWYTVAALTSAGTAGEKNIWAASQGFGFLSHRCATTTDLSTYVRGVAAFDIDTGTQPFLTAPFDTSGQFTGTTVSLSVNGVASLTDAPSTPSVPTNLITIGCNVFSGGLIEFWPGQIGRLLIYNVAHNAAQRAVVRAYLRGYYGL